MIKFCAKLFLLNEYPSLFAILQILQMGDFNIFLQKMHSMQACHEPLGIHCRLLGCMRYGLSAEECDGQHLGLLCFCKVDALYLGGREIDFVGVLSFLVDGVVIFGIFKF